MYWLDAHAPIEVAGWAYCLNLAMLAHSQGCKTILEIGQGWGWSSTAFATAIKERDGAHIDSIDSHPRLKPECHRYVLNTKVGYTFYEKAARDFVPERRYDLIYIDTNSDYDGLDEMIAKFKQSLNKYGVLVLDGFLGEEGVNRIVAEKRHGEFMPLAYCDKYAHVVSIPGVLSAS